MENINVLIYNINRIKISILLSQDSAREAKQRQRLRATCDTSSAQLGEPQEPELLPRVWGTSAWPKQTQPQDPMGDPNPWLQAQDNPHTEQN